MIEERRKQIIGAVNERGAVAISELAGMFPDVSEITLRKDLKCLDEARKLVRVHGGARSIDAVYNADTPLTQRLQKNIDKKRQIAQKARALLKEGASVFLDSGSTTTELARAFVDQPCTVFTGGLSCVNELSKLRSVDIYVLGGRLNKDSLSVRDARVAREVSELYFDIAFIAINGFSRENGFCCRSSDRWEMERAVIRRASQLVVLMDSSKVGEISPFSICHPRDIDILISDDALDPDTRAYFESEGVCVR